MIARNFLVGYANILPFSFIVFGAAGTRTGLPFGHKVCFFHIGEEGKIVKAVESFRDAILY